MSAEGRHNTEQLSDKVKDKFCSMKVMHLGKNLLPICNRVYTCPGMDSKWTITVQKEGCGGIVFIIVFISMT